MLHYFNWNCSKSCSTLHICSDPLANPPVRELDLPVRNILSCSQTGQEVCELVDLCEFYPFNCLKRWEAPFKGTTICMNGHDTR